MSVEPGVFGARSSQVGDRPTYPDGAEIEIERDLAILGPAFLAVLQGQSDE